MHPNVSTCIANQQRNVQPMFSTEQNASKDVHKYCGSTPECPSHAKYRAECIQSCPKVFNIADQQQNDQPMWSTEQYTSRGVHKYCRSRTECPTHVKYRAECIQECPQVLQINNRMSNPCEVQSRMHPGVSTSIADQQQNVQPMWSTEQNASRGVHKYCRSTTECPTHVKYRAEYIQGCPQVLQINNRMFNPCEVQSRIHPGMSTSI